MDWLLFTVNPERLKSQSLVLGAVAATVALFYTGIAQILIAAVAISLLQLAAI